MANTTDLGGKSKAKMEEEAKSVEWAQKVLRFSHRRTLGKWRGRKKYKPNTDPTASKGKAFSSSKKQHIERPEQVEEGGC